MLTALRCRPAHEASAGPQGENTVHSFVGNARTFDAIGALHGVRVLELAGMFGAYTGHLFAGLGADVILVEPPSGAPHRRRPPFIDDVPGTERSLSFAYHHAGKRSVTLNLDTADGRDLFRRLAATAQIVVESDRPGAMGVRGLGYEDLVSEHPSLVYTSISCFGQTGPYAEFAATDTTLLAMGGLLYLGGNPDTEPMQVSGDQAVLAADQFAAVASLLALLSAETTGQGRRVDVAAQECVVMALESAAQEYDLQGSIRRRFSTQRSAGAGVYPCKDGYVYMLVMTRGLGVLKFWPLFLEWLKAEGVPGVERLMEPGWGTAEVNDREEAKQTFAEVFLPFTAQRTKAELYRAAQEWRLPLCPVSTPSDLVQSPQLKHRGFFVSAPHPLIEGGILSPGAPFQMSATPWSLREPAPLVGEHNVEVLPEVGVEKKDLPYLKAAGVL